MLRQPCCCVGSSRAGLSITSQASWGNSLFLGFRVRGTVGQPCRAHNSQRKLDKSTMLCTPHRHAKFQGFLSSPRGSSYPNINAIPEMALETFLQGQGHKALPPSPPTHGATCVASLWHEHTGTHQRIMRDFLSPLLGTPQSFYPTA